MVSIVSTWTTRKMHDFQGYFFPRLSRTEVIFQDSPGHRLFKKTSRTFQEVWEPCRLLYRPKLDHRRAEDWDIDSCGKEQMNWSNRSVITNLVGGTGHILEVNSWLLEALGRRAVQVDGTQRRFISTHVRWILHRQTDLSENLRQHDQQNAADALWCIWLNAYDPAKYFCFGYCWWGSGCQVDRRIRTGRVHQLCQLNE